jgi:hypothetical protein
LVCDPLLWLNYKIEGEMNEELQEQERHGPRMLDSVPDVGSGAGAGPSTVVDKFVH